MVSSNLASRNGPLRAGVAHSLPLTHYALGVLALCNELILSRIGFIIIMVFGAFLMPTPSAACTCECVRPPPDNRVAASQNQNNDVMCRGYCSVASVSARSALIPTGTCMTDLGGRSRTDYSPAFCVKEVPASWRFESTVTYFGKEDKWVCLKIPTGQRISRLYCLAADQQSWPTQQPCHIAEGAGESCVISWSWINNTKATKLTDSSHEFCVRFSNQTKDITRLFQLKAD